MGRRERAGPALYLSSFPAWMIMSHHVTPCHTTKQANKWVKWGDPLAGLDNGMGLYVVEDSF